MLRASCRLILLMVLLAGVQDSWGAPPRRTRNVILVMTDGLRWQEVFRGPDVSILSFGRRWPYADESRRRFVRSDPVSSREALMPFLWTVVAKQGQLLGNQEKGSDVHVTNGRNISYPGYHEVLCGFSDPILLENAFVLNRNITVFEWLHRKREFKGKVAAFAAWKLLAAIFNRSRCGFLVSAGLDPMPGAESNPKIALINRLKAETPSMWEGQPYDSFTFHSAFEYFREKKPRLFFLGLSETDEWGHAGAYPQYLRAANRFDSYLKTLWDTLQSMSEYRGNTTLIVTCDHGRGTGYFNWRNHGATVKGSEASWIAVIGPDTLPLGERTNCEAVTHNQIAATIAALLGYDYSAAAPNAGKPIGAFLQRQIASVRR